MTKKTKYVVEEVFKKVDLEQRVASLEELFIEMLRRQQIQKTA